MKISLKWLSEYVSIPDNLQEFCDQLELTGTEVEGTEVLGSNLEGIVVGYVESCKEHPDSDHMHVVEVDVGDEELVQIVCGAPNIAAGIKVPVAKVGAIMPEGFKIKKAKLRGVQSCGMCCSKRELGQGSDHEGIWVLPEDAPVGKPIAEYLELCDTVLDLEITPNRPDCLSVQGIAREVGAIFKKPVVYPESTLTEDNSLPPIQESVTVEVQDGVRCPRYTARLIANVKVGPSPEWLATRVVAAGARSINNVVDATNYILFLLGQPLHAFDFDKIVSADGKAHIVVRPAEEGEHFTTLDNVERVFSNDMTVIASPEHILALAGVMGGLESEVSDQTTTILLETATFEKGRTSRTSRNLGLISESSLRFERGVDDNNCDFCAAYAAQLIADISGGSVVPGIIDVYSQHTEENVLTFRIPRFHKMIGAAVSVEEMIDMLQRLGCQVTENKEDNTLSVVTPTFRPDLEREIDLYEEVLRLYGMDKVEATLPEGSGRLGERTAEERAMDTINNTMRACGLNETTTYSFAEVDDCKKLRMSTEGLGQAVELLNPINSQQAVLRQSIIPGLLRSVSFNQNRGVSNIQLYETGTVFFGRQGHKTPQERKKLAGVLTGAMGDPAWNNKPACFDFFDGKGIVENLGRELCISKLNFKEADCDSYTHMQPGRGAVVFAGGVQLGWVGEIHPLAVAAFDVEGPVVAFELDIEALLKCAQNKRDFIAIPQYPAITIDQAFVVDEHISNERMVQIMQSAGGKLLESVKLFDVYRDPQRIGEGKKSLAYSITYRALDRTLKTEEVEKVNDKLLKKVKGATGAEIRS